MRPPRASCIFYKRHEPPLFILERITAGEGCRKIAHHAREMAAHRRQLCLSNRNRPLGKLGHLLLESAVAVDAVSAGSGLRIL